jgi:hypothetical protein
MATPVEELLAGLTTLTDINQLLMNTVELDELLREILQAVIRLFGVVCFFPFTARVEAG